MITGKSKQPIMFVLLTPREIQYTPVAVEAAKINNPKKPETRKTIIIKTIKVNSQSKV